MTDTPTPDDLLQSTGEGPTHYGEFLGAEPLTDTPTPKRTIDLVTERDWRQGEFGPMQRCGSCWMRHPAYWDCQAHPVTAADAALVEALSDD